MCTWLSFQRSCAYRGILCHERECLVCSIRTISCSLFDHAYSQAPDLYSILSTRLVSFPFLAKPRCSTQQLSSIHSFQSSLDMVRDKAPLFDTRKGYAIIFLKVMFLTVGRYVWEIEKSAQMTESSANASIKAAETADKESSKETSSKPASSVKSNAEAMLWVALQTTAKDMR